MNVIDIIFLITMVLCVVVGIFKGLVRQILTILGIITVASLTATFAPYVQGWFANVIASEGTRNVIAMIVAALLIAVVYALVAILVTRILRKIKIFKLLDKLLGGVLGFVVVYLVFAVIFALFNDTGAEFMSLLKKVAGKSFAESWVGNHIYANNFFGRWIIVDIAQKLLNSVSVK